MPLIYYSKYWVMGCGDSVRPIGVSHNWGFLTGNWGLLTGNWGFLTGNRGFLTGNRGFSLATGDFSLATGDLFVGGWQVGKLGNGPRGREQERMPDGWHMSEFLFCYCINYSTTGKWGCAFVGNAIYELAEYSLSLSKYIHLS